MSPPNKTELLEELIRDIQDTSDQVHDLLKELNDSKIDLAVLKTELKNIVVCISDLTKIIRDENSDGLGIVARITILENSIKEVGAYIEQHKDVYVSIAVLEQKVSTLEEKVGTAHKIFENYIASVKTQNQVETNAKISGKWQMRAVLLTGILGIFGTIISFMLQNC
jgi:chromosome segregation ATPase